MIYLILTIITVVLFFIYDYFTYKRIAYLDARIQELDIRYNNICSNLNKKIEDHKLETRRIV